MIMDMIGVSKWSRHKDRYIGRLYLDIRMIPGEIGHLPMYREVTGTPRGVYGPYWALVELMRGRETRRERHPSPIRIGKGADPPFLPPSSPFLLS